MTGLNNSCVSVYLYIISISFPQSSSSNKGESSFSLASALFTVHCVELEYPAQRLPPPTKQCIQMSPSLLLTLSLQPATSAAMPRAALLTSALFVFPARGPKTGSMSSKCVVCFLHSSIQPSPLIRLTFLGEKIYIWDDREGERDVYAARWSQYQALYTHCTLSQNTVMLEIRMAFHANRGARSAGDRLVLQTALK